jgi:hypothetical protein
VRRLRLHLLIGAGVVVVLGLAAIGVVLDAGRRLRTAVN